VLGRRRMTRVALPPLNMLAVDFAASLFRLTAGDVEADDVESSYVFRVADLGKFGAKLGAFAERADKVLGRFYNLLGGFFVRRDCGVETVQALAKSAAGSTDAILRQLSAVREETGAGNVEVLWGEGPFVKNPPPLLQSVEFMEGVRTWPAVQFDAEGSGAKTKVRSGFRRAARPSCAVLGALALGASATYVAGGQRQGVIRFLIPLSFVEYDAVAAGMLGRLGALGVCDLPEPLARLIVAALAGRPAVFKLVDIVYTGGIEVERDSSKELAIDTRSLGRHLHRLRDYAHILLGLAERWCRCEREGWPEECGDVGRAGAVAARIYLYAETGRLEHAYEALGALLRLSRDAAGDLTRLVEDLIW